MLSLLETGSVDFSSLIMIVLKPRNILLKTVILYLFLKNRILFMFLASSKTGHVVYKTGMDYRYYLHTAGGLGEYAKRR